MFVPKSHHQKVLDAVLDAGAGSIGNYSHCSFNIDGYGTFVPGDATQPFIGKQGQMERVEEVRIETIVPNSIRNKVVQAMLKAHPYEEVAYDLYPMDMKGRTLGLGRVGKLSAPVLLQELVDKVKKQFDVKQVRVVGDLNRQIKKAAVLGGSGSRNVNHALFRGADVIVTGDIDYHTAHDALMAGIAIIDPGHNIEKIMKPNTVKWLKEKLEKGRYATEVNASEIDTEPFQFV